ncbi:MAG: phosphoadenylyl-sulfate reductase [Proteobacteria bacterium]|nr:phosphoadenylyl-sulfate reductase [Pseudomonadota bacterium]
MLSSNEIQELNASLQDSQPKEVLKQALALFPNAAISFSGAEDVLLIELASKLPTMPAIFTLDTGRLHPETYRFIERIRQHYDTPVEVLFPDADKLEKLVKTKGLYSFFEDGHEECCGIRKVEPMRRRIRDLDAWITGQRRDQSPSRSEVAIVELDTNFSTESHSVIKVNPLANWNSADVWNYLRLFDVPYNELHDRGYVSIGCEPCTRAIGPNQHEREGRWWWEEETIKECGLHLPGTKIQN